MASRCLTEECTKEQPLGHPGSDKDMEARDLANFNNIRLCLRTPSMESESNTTPQAHINFNDWYNIVRNYSTRLLSFPTDKLPAISGLAGRMAAVNS